MENSAYEVRINPVYHPSSQAHHNDAIHKIHAIRWRHAFKLNSVLLAFVRHITVEAVLDRLDVCHQIIRWALVQQTRVKTVEPV